MTEELRDKEIREILRLNLYVEIDKSYYSNHRVDGIDDVVKELSKLYISRNRVNEIIDKVESCLKVGYEKANVNYNLGYVFESIKEELKSKIMGSEI